MESVLKIFQKFVTYFVNGPRRPLRVCVASIFCVCVALFTYLRSFTATLEDAKAQLKKYSNAECEDAKSDSSEEPMHVRREKAARFRAAKQAREVPSGSSDEGEFDVDGVATVLSLTEERVQSCDEGFLSQSVESGSTSVRSVIQADGLKSGENDGDLVRSLIEDWDMVFDGSQRSDGEGTTAGEVTTVAASPRKGTSPRKNAFVKELSPQKSGGSKVVPRKTPQKEGDESVRPSGETARKTPKKTPMKTPQKAKDAPKNHSLSESPRNGSHNDARKKKSPQEKDVEKSSEMAKVTRAGTPRKNPEGDLRKPGASPFLDTAASSHVSPRKRDRTASFGSTHTHHKRSRQTDMSTFVSSFSERELDRELKDLDTELEAAGRQLCTSPDGSLQSMSPAVSEASDGVFKTPRDKGAYRALSFGSCSPSVSSGAFPMHVPHAISRL